MCAYEMDHSEDEFLCSSLNGVLGPIAALVGLPWLASIFPSNVDTTPQQQQQQQQQQQEQQQLPYNLPGGQFNAEV